MTMVLDPKWNKLSTLQVAAAARSGVPAAKTELARRKGGPSLKRRAAKALVKRREANLSNPGEHDVDLSKMSSKRRDSLPSSAFVFPKTRKFPIPDEAHARAALRLSGRVSPSMAAVVRATVYRRYPQLRPKKG